MQVDLRMTITEDIDVSRMVIVHENHNAEATRAEYSYHAIIYPNMIGLQVIGASTISGLQRIMSGQS